MRPRFVSTAATPSVRALEAGHLRVRVDLHPEPVRRAREPPHDRVVTDDPARRVVERAHDRPGRTIGEIELRAELADPIEADDLRVDSENLIDLGALLHDDHRAVRVRERQVPALREHEVEVELRREPLVQADALAVEVRPLGCAVVRADDRRVPARRARADVRLLEHGDVADPVVLREVVRRRKPVRPAAHDHDLVAPLELAPRPPHRFGKKISFTRVLQASQGVEDDLGDVVAELLREVDAEVLALVAHEDRADAREAARGGKRVEIEVREPSEQLLALDREPCQPSAEVIGTKPQSAKPLDGLDRIAIDEQQATPRRQPDELLPVAGLDEIQLAANLHLPVR